jgi:pimeloyl-ACP methyl ester carboxylesterase
MPMLSDVAMWEEMSMRAVALTGYGGAQIGECQAAIDALGDGGVDQWHDSWNSTAQRLDDQGRISAAEGDPVSARDSLMRASTYYRISYCPLFGTPVDERLRVSFEAEVNAFESAADLGPGNLTPLEVPFEGGSLPGYLATPVTPGKAKGTVLQVNGFDSNVHEMFFADGVAATDHGYNWIGVDGPGQGRNLIRDGIPLRPDWENVVGPILDHIEGLEGVAGGNIVLLGWSLGGFLAPRAAAFHSDRLAALIADPGQWDQREMVVGGLPLSDGEKREFPEIDRSKIDRMEESLRAEGADPMTRWRLIDRGLWATGTATLFDFFARLVEFELSSVAGGISCPTLATTNAADPISANAPKLLEAVSGPGHLLEFTAAEGAAGHCEGLARRLFHERVYDWLDMTLS